MTGEGLLSVVGFPMSPSAHVRTGSITVRSRRLLVGSELYAGRIGKYTRVTCETDQALTAISMASSGSRARAIVRLNGCWDFRSQ